MREWHVAFGRYLICLACASSTACAPVQLSRDSMHRPVIDTILSERSEAELSGWLSYRGEIAIYDSLEALRLGLVYPYAVCGVVDPNLNLSTKQLDGRKVRVTVERFEWNSLSREAGDIPTRRMLNGQFVNNGCYGRYVIYVKQLTVEP
jgi:hypothetical protein